MPASQNTNGPAQKEKLVVLGGGCGAMSSIFELTNDPTWKERYESITLYQMGWRLGGKGASGRGPDGRIEEHGLHIWPGFYNNAFGVIQRAYTEMGRPAGTPLATWTDAFSPTVISVLGSNSKMNGLPGRSCFRQTTASQAREQRCRRYGIT
jgi:uncharacterized protein with NAD-binding domain and iron-sulfur cluster